MGKKRLLFLTLLMTICSCLFAQSYGYHYPYGNEFDNNMSVGVKEVSIDGKPQFSASLELGAFCENDDIVYRGREFVGNDNTCWISVYGEYGDFISFKLYDHSTGKEYSDFTINVNGSIENGLTYDEDEGYWDIEIDFKSPLHYVYAGEGGDNMAITAVVSIDGVEQKSDKLELGAFCNGIVRGSAKTDYIYNDRYLAAPVTVYGNKGDAISFKLYDHESGTEIEFKEVTTITFDTDADYGTVGNPRIINFITKDYVAEIVGGDKYETLEEALKAAKDNDEIRLLQDVTINESINVEFSMTLDGDGHTLTYTGEGAGARAINVESNMADLTVENLTIDCTASYCQRGINYNTTANLTLNGVTVKGTNVTYAVNLPSNSDGSIITIENSSLNGNIALNIWGENTVVNATDSDFISVDNASHENYAAISINNDGSNSAEGTALNITRGSIKALDENGDWSTALSNATINSTWNISQETEVIGYIRDVVAIIPFEGSTQYYSFFTLQDAVDYAVGKNNVTVKVIRDVELTEMVQINGNVTLDLNSKTVTSSSTKTFEVYANATIKNGTIANTAVAGRCVDTRKNVELALIDVNLDAKTGGGNNQALTIGGSENGTKVNLTNVNIVSGAASNYQGYGIITFVQTELNVVDSNILGYMAIYVKDGSQGSVINVSNSTLTSDMSGNNVAGNATSVIALEADNVKVNVVGGEINPVGDYMYAVGTAKANNEIIVDSEINGNILHPEANVDANLIVVRDDYSNTLIQQGYAVSEYQEGLVKIEVVYVAQVGETKYKTVAAAVAAANAGETVKLLADVTEDVTVGKSLTIDGANFKYTGNISVSGTSTAMTVKNVNFIDGTGYAVTTNRIKSITVENCTATNYGYGFLYANKSTPTVVVKNVTVDGGNYGFHWVYGTTATLENVTMTNVTNGLYIQNYASKTINVKDCEITSIGIWERSGYSGVQTFNFEGASTVGTLSASQYAKYVLKAADATLTAPEGLEVTTSVAGHIVDYDETDGKYYLRQPNYVAAIGETKYESLVEAYDAAQSGATVKLLKNATGAGAKINKDITIDFGGFTYSFNEGVGSGSLTSNGFQLLGGNVVLKNGTLEVADADASEFYILVQNYTNLTVENMTLDGTNLDKWSTVENNWDSYTLSNNSGEVDIINTKIYANNEGVNAFAFDVDDNASYTSKPVVNVSGENTLVRGNVEVDLPENLNISGGLFTNEIEDEWCAEGYIPTTIVVDGITYYTVKPGEYVAQVGDKKFESFDEALAYAKSTTDNDAITILKTIVLSADQEIDFEDIEINSTVNPAFRIQGGANVIVKNGNMNTDNYNFILGASDGSSTGNLTIESGSYKGASSVASVTKGLLTINGGEFEANASQWGSTYLINCIDANYNADPRTANVEIKGGTFHNWNPQDNAAEGTGTDFCHADYAATETAANVWTVLPAVAKIGEARFATLQDAVNAADATNNTIDLIADVQLDTYVTISESVNLNLDQFNITRENGTALYVNGAGIEVAIDGTTGTVSGAQAVYVDNGTVTIDGGNYVGHHAVYVINNGHAVINDGTFKLKEGADPNFLLNEYDATRDITTIAVYGGTFHGFDPENNAAEGAGTNFCADGYLSDDNGDGTYTVREAAYVAQVNDGAKYESLVEAYDAAQSGDVVTLLTDATGAGLKINKDITIDFGGYTYTINQAVGSNNTESQGFQLLKNNTVTLKNGNIAIAENTNVKWMFNAYADVTLENLNVNCANMAEPAENEKNYVLVVNNGGGATPTVTYSGVSYTDFPGSNAALYVDPSTKLVAEEGLNVETCNGYVVVYSNGAYIAIPEVSEGDAVAKIDEILFKTFAEAYETAVDGDEIVILKDITFNSIVEIHKNITIDINYKTLTGTAEKFFRVFNDVTFKNGNIVNNTNNGRCVETRAADIALELDNVSLIAENGASQPLTIGGSGDNIAVNINASEINAGKYGYAVIVFNPVVMNIDYSTVEGWSALYFKGEDNSLGSAGSVVNVNDSEITGTNHVSASDPTNTFATIQFEDENVTLNVNGDDSRIRAYEEEHNHQYVFALPETNDIKVNVENTVIISAAHFLNCDLLGNAEIILPKFYKEDINEEGYWAEDYGNDQVIVRQQFIAAASIGETLYQSLEDAYEAAVAGDEITLLKDVETEYDSYDFTNVTLNLNGNTIYTQSYFVGDNFTITNGNVDGRNANYGLRIGNVNAAASNVIIDNLNVVGGVEVYNASNVTLTNNTVNGTGEYAVLARENVTDLEIKSGTYYGTEGMDAVYHNGESEVITTGGTYNSNVELAGYCPDGYYAKDNGNGTWTVVRSAVLDVDLAKGWNWFSSYVNIDGTQGWSLLTNALTGFGIEIKDQYNQVASYNNIVNRWTGTLTSTSTNQMYKIYTTQPGNVYIEGTTVEGVEITLYSGSNWIAYPVDKPLNIVDALRDFTPTPGDQISTLTGFVEYMDYSDIMGGDTQYNGWYDANYNFNTFTFVPGQGYMYYSNANNPVTFTYNTDAPAATAKSDSDSDRFWNVNPHMYPSNMVITAVLNVDGELAEGNYEIAAFCNGECRGSGKLVYCKPLDQYIVRILVHGEGVENLTFMCYDIDADMVYELDNMVVYSDNARLGSMKEPYVFNRNTTGVDENSSAMINIYPNPTTTNSEINLNAVCDKVEVFNALGVKIAEYDNVDSIDPLQTAGVYVIRVSNNDDVTHCRLVVK